MRGLVALGVVAAITLSAAAASGSPVFVVHRVEASGTEFTPKTVSVRSGDSVEWFNGGGTHNVVFTDGNYRSGEPTSSTGRLGSRGFGNVGTFTYFCEVHGDAQGGGMSGEVVVQTNTTVPPTPTPTPTATVLPNAALESVRISRRAREGRVSGRVTVEPFDQPGADLIVTLLRSGKTLRTKVYPKADGVVRFALRLPMAPRDRLEDKGRLRVVVELETDGSALRRTVTLKP